MDSSNFLSTSGTGDRSLVFPTFSITSKSKQKFNNLGSTRKDLEHYRVPQFISDQSDNINYNQNRFHLLDSSHSNWRQKPQNPPTYFPSKFNHQRKKPSFKFQKKNLRPPLLQSSDFPPINLKPDTHHASNVVGKYLKCPTSKPLVHVLPSQDSQCSPHDSFLLPYKKALQSNPHLSFNQQVNETPDVFDDLSSESSIDWDLEEQIDLIPEYIQNFIDSHFSFQDYYNFFHHYSLKFIDDQLLNSEPTTLQLIFLQQHLNIFCPIDVCQLQFIILGYLKVLFPDPCDSDSFFSDDLNL